MVTISEIAKLAGVSISTVSKSLNGYSEISEETKKRVKEIANNLGYCNNSLTNGTVKRKNNLIGIIYKNKDGFNNNIYSSILDSFRNTLSKRGFDIVVFSDNNCNFEFLKQYKKLNIDGLLLMSGLDKGVIEKIIEFEIPFVNLMSVETQINSIFSNVYNSINKSLRYLYELGHRKIAFINGFENDYSNSERLKAYLDFTNEKNIDQINLIGNHEYLSKVEEGYQNMKRIFEIFGLPDAVCAVSDLMAVGSIEYLTNNGYLVPNDVSVIGFDDLDICNVVKPKLTTLKQDGAKIGQKAASSLLSMLDKKILKFDSIVIENEIIVRDSCKKK